MHLNHRHRHHHRPPFKPPWPCALSLTIGSMARLGIHEILDIHSLHPDGGLSEFAGNAYPLLSVLFSLINLCYGMACPWTLSVIVMCNQFSMFVGNHVEWHRAAPVPCDISFCVTSRLWILTHLLGTGYVFSLHRIASNCFWHLSVGCCLPSTLSSQGSPAVSMPSLLHLDCFWSLSVGHHPLSNWPSPASPQWTPLACSILLEAKWPFLSLVTLSHILLLLIVYRTTLSPISTSSLP